MTKVQSLKIVNRYDSDVVLHDSKDYPEFSGDVWNDFILFLVNKKANLSEANLYKANLYKANLYKANLSGANLSEANLSEANLYKANLYKANLSEANLSEANLSEANLSGAYLSEANLSGAYLSEANLYKANLSEANLSEANLSEANLSGAYLYKANLLNSARNKIKGVNCLEFNFNSCFTFLLVKNKKTAHLQIGCKKHTLDEWKLEFNVNNEYIDDCEDEANYNLHKDYFFKYLDLFESFLKEN